MSYLSNAIEEFIKSMLREQGSPLELQRNELANYFSCAPSQINYVLATRFTLDKGYYIESRRGGGGYIRVMRIDLDEGQFIYRLLNEQIGNALDEGRARQMLARLQEMNAITARERGVMEAAVMDKGLLLLPPQLRDAVRANLLRNMLVCILSMNRKEGGAS